MGKDYKFNLEKALNKQSTKRADLEEGIKEIKSQIEELKATLEKMETTDKTTNVGAHEGGLESEGVIVLGKAQDSRCNEGKW
jgi:hypothetical protein